MSGPSSDVPRRIQRQPGGLRFEWPDGFAAELPSRVLRASCPCAKCVSEMTGERLFGWQQTPSDIRWKDVRLIGNYAIGIAFSDGHELGIYTFRLLRRLAEHPPAEAGSAPAGSAPTEV
ncbi:MAG: DUF971 domain-containing protein [Planctomycetes bacterium]|nr:DUF971 domain-containing protein [Planctomycetota bacterium]